MGKKSKAAVIGAAVGGALAPVGMVVGIPMAVGALGFTATGIATGSVAAKMMSVAAIANGGEVPAGSTVAVLQSIGAKGLSLAAKLGLSVLGSLGAVASAVLAEPDDSSDDDDPKGGGNSGQPRDKPAGKKRPH